MKREVKFEKDGVTTTCYVKTPNQAQLQQAQLEHNKVFARALKEGCLLKAKTESCLKEQGLWGEEQIKALKAVTQRLRENEEKLKMGGIKKWGEAREIALQMVSDRAEQVRLMGILNSLDEYTAEGLANNAKFDYLCSVCIVDEGGIPLCKSVQDYQERATSGDTLINIAASEFSSLHYGYDPKWEEKLDENKFLKEHGMVDDKFRLINKEGKLVDRTGRLVNEDGNYVDDQGNPVDFDGNKVDSNGEKIVETLPFLDD